MTVVATSTLYRVQNGHGQAFAPGATTPKPVRRPARVAVMLALAHKIQHEIRDGRLRDQAEAARRLGLTRARVTQLLALVLLAPDLQAQLLDLEAVDGVEPITERDLRPITRVLLWSEQRALWEELVSPRLASG